MENGYIDTSLISLRSISKNVAKEMIIKNHYTHKWSLCRVAYGIFIKTDNKSDFLNVDGERLIGCCVFGQPVGRSAAASLCSLIKIDEVLELTRLWIESIPNDKNLESYVIANCIKLIKRDFPTIKAILSYADGEENHNGKIYQATNFLYQGNSSVALMPNYSVSLTGPNEGYKWMHSRTVSSKYGSHNVEHLKKQIGKTFWRKRESNKHRYILFISDKQNNRKFIKNLKHPVLPYPKENSHKDEIEEITVDNSIKKNDFF
jgi:hypothetical protein